LLVRQALRLHVPPRVAFEAGVDCEAWPGLGIPLLRSVRILRPEDAEGRRALEWVWRVCGITARCSEEQRLERASLG